MHDVTSLFNSYNNQFEMFNKQTNNENSILCFSLLIDNNANWLLEKHIFICINAWLLFFIFSASYSEEFCFFFLHNSSTFKLLTNSYIKLQNNVPGYGDGAKEDFSDLPPNQRKKRLQQKIDDIQAKIQQETAARDGLMKMKGVYEQNPALGDPMTIESQLNQSSHKLDKLGAELIKFQGYLDEAIKAGVNLSRWIDAIICVSRSECRNALLTC